jgi:putative transcriptional regulator
MDTMASPIGRSAVEAREARAAASEAYRRERARRSPYEAIARKVLKLRMDHDLSQQQLATRVGTSHSQIARIESGQYRPTVETLHRIAEAFDFDLDVDFVPRGRREHRATQVT